MPGAMAPQFVRPDFKGAPVDLHALRGAKVVLIDFWASWCPPCMVEIPHLIDLQKRYGGRGLAVVGILDGRSPRPAAKEVASRYPFNYPLVMGYTPSSASLYGGVLGLPVLFLIGRDGKVLKGLARRSCAGGTGKKSCATPHKAERRPIAALLRTAPRKRHHIDRKLNSLSNHRSCERPRCSSIALRLAASPEEKDIP